jgi:hypothetical protein
MIKDFKNKNSDGRLLIQKCFFGFGFHIDFKSATFSRQKKFSIIIDLIFIRFFCNVYRKPLK